MNSKYRPSVHPDAQSRWRAVTVTTSIAIMLIALLPIAPRAVGGGSDTIVVSGGTLIDGTGGEPLAGATIVIRDGRVAEVTAGGASPLPGAERIDARGEGVRS